jgi:hypothetical protein
VVMHPLTGIMEKIKCNIQVYFLILMLTFGLFS